MSGECEQSLYTGKQIERKGLTAQTEKKKKDRKEDSGKLVYIHGSFPGTEESVQIRTRFWNKMKVKL